MDNKIETSESKVETQIETPKTKKGINIPAIIGAVSGTLTWLLIFFHSLIDMKAVLAFFLAPITALIAIFAGARAKRKIKKSNGQVGGKKLANFGLWTGWIYIILSAVVLVIAVSLFGGLISGVNNLLGSLGIG